MRLEVSDLFDALFVVCTMSKRVASGPSMHRARAR